jgi:2,4-dienoyl-CoA reductase-like NADH-dependent reductase (Old Yellow Enzyme family)
VAGAISLEQIKKESGILTGAVGLIEATCRRNLALGKADLVLFGRESLRNPNFRLNFLPRTVGSMAKTVRKR